MSFDDFIRVGNTGTILICTVTRIVGGAEVAVDLSGTTSVQIEVQKPNGERLTPFTAAFLTDGVDGKITFTDSTGIFDVAGRWKIRGISITGAIKLQGSWFGFPVDE
ncbi:hypothetical protein LCGC14_1254450 [marine sediment metagenome]|uniref:BppU N-terminal domain-containing protein n=1 Tax=marine sediment metagenome TaxID=412755 RepID=A0A0F9LNT3_9ZZZZ